MQPLNRKSRSAAILKFIGLYLLSIALIASAFFFFFEIPKAELNKSREVIKTTVIDQKENTEKLMVLNDQVNGINAHFNQLKEIDMGLEAALQENKLSKIAESTNALNLSETKLTNSLLDYEEALEKSGEKGTVYHSILENYKSLLSKYQTIRLMRSEQGEMNVLQEELDKANAELEMLQLMAAASGGGGGGGGAEAAATSAELVQVQNTLKVLQKQNQNLKNSINLIKGKSNNIINTGQKIERIANKIKGIGDAKDKSSLIKYAKECKDDGNRIYKIASDSERR